MSVGLRVGVLGVMLVACAPDAPSFQQNSNGGVGQGGSLGGGAGGQSITQGGAGQEGASPAGGTGGIGDSPTPPKIISAFSLGLEEGDVTTVVPTASGATVWGFSGKNLGAFDVNATTGGPFHLVAQGCDNRLEVFQDVDGSWIGACDVKTGTSLMLPGKTVAGPTKEWVGTLFRLSPDRSTTLTTRPLATAGYVGIHALTVASSGVVAVGSLGLANFSPQCPGGKEQSAGADARAFAVLFDSKFTCTRLYDEAPLGQQSSSAQHSAIWGDNLWVGVRVQQSQTDGDGYAIVYSLSTEKVQRIVSLHDSGVANDRVTRLAPTTDGMLIAGAFTKNAVIGGETRSADAGEDDAYIAKFTPDGSKLLWFVQLKGGGWSNIQDIAIAPDGRIWVAGVFVNGFSVSDGKTNFPGHNLTATAGAADGFLLVLDPSGTPFWEGLLASPNTEDVARKIVHGPDGVVHVVGTMGGDLDAFGTPIPRINKSSKKEAFYLRIQP